MTFRWDNERPDMQLEHDKQQGVIEENKRAQFYNSIPDSEFAASDEDGKKISQIVKDLVKRGGGRALYFKDQIYWDMDLNEAREEACLDCIIPDGWDAPLSGTEQINIEGRDLGHEYEITVETFEEED